MAQSEVLQKEAGQRKRDHEFAEGSKLAALGDASELAGLSARLSSSRAAMQLSAQGARLERRREGVLQLYDIRQFGSWDEHVAWLLKNHINLPPDLSLQIGELGNYVKADMTGVKAVYIPPGKKGLTEAGKKLSAEKANGTVVLSRAYVEEVGTLPKEERVFALRSTIRHEFQHAENYRSGLVKADGTENAHNLDETLAHSENILNAQLGNNSGEAPLWDQLEHLVQAEDYFGKATLEDSPLYRAAANALDEAKLKLNAVFGDRVEGTGRTPKQVMDGYLNSIDFMEHDEGRNLAVKSATMSQVLQGKFDAQPAVRQEQQERYDTSHGGLPDGLRQGIEALSGISMGHVRVHRNSSRPSRVNAHAFAQGSHIHLAAGQERHLPHEAWHVVQQAQGRVKPTMRTATGAPVNDDPALEREADLMGSRALSSTVQLKSRRSRHQTSATQAKGTPAHPLQLRGVTLDLVMRAIGTGFRLTAEDVQQTSVDVECFDGVVCHFSVPIDSPSTIHISYYPANDKDYKSKIMQYGAAWNSRSDTFDRPVRTTRKWQPYKDHLALFDQDAGRRIDELGGRILQLLNAPPPVQVPMQVPDLAGFALPNLQQGGFGGDGEGHVHFGADFIPVPPLQDGEAPPLFMGERYFGGPFPQHGDHEGSPLLFKKKAGGDGAMPIQRTLEIAHDAQSVEYDSLDMAIQSVFLRPPEPIAAAIRAIRENQDITVRIGFSTHVEGDDYAFTDVQGNEISVHIDWDMLPVEDEGSDQMGGEELNESESGDDWDNATRETELQATIIHELVLHTIPAFERLVAGQNDEDDGGDREHGNLARWKQVIAIAESVTPSVLFNSIVDSLSHFRFISMENRPAYEEMITQAVNRSDGAIQALVEGANLFLSTDVDTAHFVSGAQGYVLLSMYDTQEFLEAREHAALQQDEALQPEVPFGEGGEQFPDFIPLPDLRPGEEPEPVRNKRYLGAPFPESGEYEDDYDDNAGQFKLKPGHYAAAPIQRVTPPLQRNGERISEVARQIVAGALDIHDASLGLSESQIKLVSAILAQLEALSQVQRELDEIERLREAMYPAPIPLDSLIAFQDDFTLPELEMERMGEAFSTHAHNTLGAGARLIKRLDEGLMPGAKVKGRSPLSGDDRKAEVVSVNVLPASHGANAAAIATFATKNRAGGAIPISVEQSGDTVPADMRVLEQRALDSAVLIIDPSRLEGSDIERVQSSSQDGGEVGLSGVPSAAIVAVLVPETLAPFLKTHEKRFNIRYVGAETGSAYSASAGAEEEFTYPNYQAALCGIFAANPKKTLVTHTTRLGLANPVVR